MPYLFLNVWNENDDEIGLLIEPHLEVYRLQPHKRYEIYSRNKLSDEDLRKALVVAHREREIVVYSPDTWSPLVMCDGVELIPDIA